MWMFNGYGMGTGGWLLLAVLWVGLVALVVVAILRLIPGRGESAHEPREPAPQPREPAAQPHEILKRRLASGEIDVDTYERLSSKLGPPSLAGRA